MRSITNIFAYNRLNEFQKPQYRAGFINLDGTLTDIGRINLEAIVSEKYQEEMAAAARQRNEEEPIPK